MRSYDHLNFSRASVFSFKRLDILCAWIGHSSEKLWPFEFLENFNFSIFSSSIYHRPQSYTLVKSYAVWIGPELPCSILSVSIYFVPESDIRVKSYDHLNFLRASVILSISSISIHHGPQSYTHVKSYGRLNLPRASVVNFKGLDVWCTWIGHLSETL